MKYVGNQVNGPVKGETASRKKKLGVKQCFPRKEREIEFKEKLLPPLLLQQHYIYWRPDKASSVGRDKTNVFESDSESNRAKRRPHNKRPGRRERWKIFHHNFDGHAERRRSCVARTMTRSSTRAFSDTTWPCHPCLSSGSKQWPNRLRFQLNRWLTMSPCYIVVCMCDP